MTTPEIRCFPDAEALSQAAAEEFIRLAGEAVASRGRFRVALAGGSTPRRLYQLLAEEPRRSRIDWGAVEVFWGDERAVPPDHPQSNFRMAREALLDRVPIPPGHIHRMEAERSDRERAAEDYQAALAHVFREAPAEEPPAFDLILLGMGPDGHTASLFPHTAALRELDRWVVVNHVPQLSADRLTLTFPVLNRARAVLFQVAGENKQQALREVLAGPPDPERLPSQRVRPAGKLMWLVDEAAAGPDHDPTKKGAVSRRVDVKLAPSILSADFARLGEQVREAEEGLPDRIHVDIMDGHFVPNISIGPPVVQAIRPITALPLEAHLMIEEPDRYIEAFIKAGADSLLVHIENDGDLRSRLRHIRHLGKKPGVVLNPETPADERLAAILHEVGLVLVMTVHPGFGGQSFMHEMLDKVRKVRRMIDDTGCDIDLEVDGGIHTDTAPLAVKAGARVLVAGTAVFRAPEGVPAAMQHLRAAAAG